MAVSRESTSGAGLAQYAAVLAEIEGKAGDNEPEVAGTLRPLLDALRAVSERLRADAAGTPAAVEAAVRADENLFAAAVALDRGVNGTDLQDALYHARRAIAQLEACAAVTAEATRETDRIRNEREFLNG